MSMKSTGALLAALMALGVTGGANAQSAGTSSGLGQAWPNAADVSAAPNWHVYVFRMNGIKYVQINDLSGTVHAAVATANGTTIVLPVGIDAKNVTTTAKAASSTAQVVYKDASTVVTATPESNGTAQFSVISDADSCPDLYDCSAVAPSVN
jgi:hypothetical protein